MKSSMAAEMDEGMEASWKELASNGRWLEVERGNL